MHEAIGLVVRQRPDQHAVDHAEDGGRCADAERERQHGDDGEDALPAQRADGDAEVGENTVHGLSLAARFVPARARRSP